MFQIPEDAYELNFVLTDGESLYDNNSGQDYTFAAAAGSTWEEWQAAAVERAEATAREAVAAEEVGAGRACKRLGVGRNSTLYVQ